MIETVSPNGLTLNWEMGLQQSRELSQVGGIHHQLWRPRLEDDLNPGVLSVLICYPHNVQYQYTDLSEAGVPAGFPRSEWARLERGQNFHTDQNGNLTLRRYVSW